MPSLNDLPNELLISILEHLHHLDPTTLLLAQRTSRRFRAASKGILFPTYASTLTQPGRYSRKSLRSAAASLQPLRTNPLLHGHFDLLIQGPASACLEADERAVSVWPTLNGDTALPFRRLPWAGDQALRGRFLATGERASWRGLSVTAGGVITRLEMVRSYQTEASDEVECRVVDLDLAAAGGPPSSLDSTGPLRPEDELPGYLTMGLLYDLLLSRGTHFGRETGDWELFLGMRLRSHALLHEYGCFIPGDDELVDCDALTARDCAILYVQGATMDEEEEEEEEEEFWDEERETYVPWDHHWEQFAEEGDAELEYETEWVPHIIGFDPKTGPWDGM
jgi:hypothetical protein